MFGSDVQRINWRWGLIRSVGMNSWPPTLLLQGLALLASPLAMFVEEVDLWSTAIADLTPLAGLQCLRVLNLGRATKVTDLAPLASLRALRTVWLGHTNVASLAPLRALPHLAQFECDHTRVPAAEAAELRARLA
jgi:hypothetical protein